MTIGERIRAERERRGWSQETLGFQLGKSKVAVCTWENDTYKPSIADRVYLSRLLLIPLNELLPELRTDASDIIAVKADRALQQVLLLWPEIAEPLRDVILMLCIDLRDRSADMLSEPLTERAG